MTTTNDKQQPAQPMPAAPAPVDAGLRATAPGAGDEAVVANLIDAIRRHVADRLGGSWNWFNGEEAARACFSAIRANPTLYVPEVADLHAAFYRMSDEITDRMNTEVRMSEEVAELRRQIAALKAPHE